MQIVLMSTFGYISGRYMLNICLHAVKMEANGIHMIKLYLTKYLMISEGSNIAKGAFQQQAGATLTTVWLLLCVPRRLPATSHPTSLSYHRLLLSTQYKVIRQVVA